MSGKGRTLKDLAEKLDISVATVSRALAGHARIAAETRERVAAAAREIGYVPNRAARALVSGRSGFAGLVLPSRGYGVGDAFVGELVSGLTQGLGRSSIDLFLTNVPEGDTELAAIRRLVEGRRADGLVIVRLTEGDARVAWLLSRGFPFVAHGRFRAGGPSAFPWVDADGFAAFGDAFDLLYGLGHRNFALVTVDEPVTFRLDREAGLADAIARRGDPAVRLETIPVSRFDREARAAAIRALLARPDRPTAVIGLFDGLALATLAEASRLGLSVPGDVSVVGFDDVAGAAQSHPGLTTFDSAIHDCAEQMAGILARAIAAPQPEPESRLIRPRLVLRASHGPAPR